jgi:hypothetical protein
VKYLTGHKQPALCDARHYLHEGFLHVVVTDAVLHDTINAPKAIPDE